MASSIQTLTAEVLPVAATISPVQAFLRFARLERPFFLDSAAGPARLGQWSILGAEPTDVLAHTVGGPHGHNPFHELAERLAATPLARPDTLVPFVGGAVGMLAYDLGRHVEPTAFEAGAVAFDLPIPQMWMGLYDAAAAYEHATGRWYVAGFNAERVRRWRRLLTDARDVPPPAEAPADRPAGRLDLARGPELVEEMTCNFTRDEYLAAVAAAHEYIAAGDIFQVNLSQRFQTRRAADPLCLYLRLRQANPAPFAAYLADGDWAVLSSSPERFLKVVDGHVETRPIKGTRPRRADPAADVAMQRELLASEKDNAELAMIVDLERNDLGRVCDYGSIAVAEPRVLETYAAVHHLVATVVGRLHPRYGLVDLLKATFPGGSITGAPKVRAMQIIGELEPTARSVYTGAIGYLGFDGRADLNIAIRTLLCTANSVTLQVGGGIVADSTPEGEYDETLAKAKAMFAALAG